MKKGFTTIIATYMMALALLGGTTSCVSHRQTTTDHSWQHELAVLNEEWTISKVYGKAIEKLDRTPYLVFDAAKNRIHGYAGCNNINGGFTHEKGKAASLKFGQMISTMMAGPGMDTERKVLQALNNVRSYKMNKKRTSLDLLDEMGNTVLTLRKNTGKKLSR